MPDDLQSILGHHFSDPGLLLAALVHRSYSADNPDAVDNERLEFLGDAVLQLVVTEYLFVNHGDLREGEMAKVRAGCVNRSVLADLAGALSVGVQVVMSPGEEASGGRAKESILA
ncbi:MAG: ribonuclease III, partial [Acidimicrobiia bacterium]|nr:ribonuclease III [Acidimicrobiia bacterium]